MKQILRCALNSSIEDKFLSRTSATRVINFYVNGYNKGKGKGK